MLLTYLLMFKCDYVTYVPTYHQRQLRNFQGNTVPSLRLRITGANSQNRTHMRGSKASQDLQCTSEPPDEVLVAM